MKGVVCGTNLDISACGFSPTWGTSIGSFWPFSLSHLSCVIPTLYYLLALLYSIVGTED